MVCLGFYYTGFPSWNSTEMLSLLFIYYHFDLCRIDYEMHIAKRLIYEDSIGQEVNFWEKKWVKTFAKPMFWIEIHETKSS